MAGKFDKKIMLYKGLKVSAFAAASAFILAFAGYLEGQPPEQLGAYVVLPGVLRIIENFLANKDLGK